MHGGETQQHQLSSSTPASRLKACLDNDDSSSRGADAGTSTVGKPARGSEIDLAHIRRLSIKVYQSEALCEENPEIRLLTLLPEEDENTGRRPIRCKLHRQFAMASAMPKYTALSYCWGSADEPARIIVNGHEYYITQNLEAALLEMRRRGIMHLWADALCINQYDNHEKGHQIHRMRDIYRYAETTVAWLGVDDDKNGGGGHDTLATKTFGRLLSADSDNKKPAWSDVETLVALPYWHRAWIIQELALSNPSTALVVWAGRDR